MKKTQESVKWIRLKDLLRLLKEMDVWTVDTKYLNIYLDTRYVEGDWRCTVRDSENQTYLTLEDLRELRRPFNDFKS